MQTEIKSGNELDGGKDGGRGRKKTGIHRSRDRRRQSDDLDWPRCHF